MSSGPPDPSEETEGTAKESIPAREQEHGATVECRIQRIMKMMRSLKFVTGKTVPRLAAEWGITASRVAHLSAEASKRVRAEVMNPEHVGATVGTALEDAIKSARSAKDWKTVGQLAHTWATISGAIAPKRSEHTGRNGGPIPFVDLSKLSDEQLQRLHAGDLSSVAGGGGIGDSSSASEPDDVEDER